MGVSRLFYSPSPPLLQHRWGECGRVHVATNDTQDPKLLDTVDREQAVGHYGHAKRGICKKEISATLRTVSALVCLPRHSMSLSFLFPTVVARITSPTFVLKFRERDSNFEQMEQVTLSLTWIYLFIFFQYLIGKSKSKDSILNQKKKKN